MSSYPPPVACLPTFNSQEFSYSSSCLTVSSADKRYLKLTGGIESGLVTFNGGLTILTIYNVTGTFTVPNSGSGTLATTSNVVDLSSNQTVGGQKNFSSITTFNTTNGVAGGQEFTVNSLLAPYNTRLYSVNDTYSTDLYYPKFNGIDTLVSTASTATLTNKTMGTFKVGSNGTVVSNTSFGNFTTGSPGVTYPTFTINHNLGATSTFSSAIVNKTGFSTTDSFLVMVNNWTSTQITFMITRTDTNSG